MYKYIIKVLTICLALPLLFASAAAEDVSTYPSLKEFYTGYFDFGSSMSSTEARDTDRLAFYAAQYSIVTPENALKPENVIDEYNSSKAAKEDQGNVALHFNAAKPLLEFAQANGLMVNGHVLWLQCHYQLRTPTVSQFRNALQKIVDKGLKIRVTEMDILVDDNSEDSFQLQAKRYEDLMKVLLKYSDSIIAVQTWGTFDSKSWKSDNYPLLFNGDGTAKPAFYDGLSSQVRHFV